VELLPPGARPHVIVNTDKLHRDLGYADVVTARDALRDTVEWLLENPVTAAEYPLYAAKFDYELDEEMIERYKRAVDRLHRDVPDPVPEIKHPMPHPKTPSLTVDERGR
jgi:hypothetical protein